MALDDCLYALQPTLPQTDGRGSISRQCVKDEASKHSNNSEAWMMVRKRSTLYRLNSRPICSSSIVILTIIISAISYAEFPLIAEDANVSNVKAFVQASGTNFVLNGKPYFVAGVNNHYLTFGSNQEVTRVLDDAVSLGANVVRTFLQPVIGSVDGTVPTIWNWKKESETSDLGVNGTYLLYWDSIDGKMAINEGVDGMQKVDFLIAEARKRNLKLIIAFLDFWSYTGGAQQVSAWYRRSDKYTFFFTDPRAKKDYRTWVQAVVQRLNPLTGVSYMDDPTIFAWELMNEPYARPDGLRKMWITEMSDFVKSIDKNHLVSSGHANVYNRLSDLNIPGIDFGTWHGYPLYYKLSPAQFNALINEFCALGREMRKPVLLEEFGYARGNPDQALAYQTWLNTIHDNNDCAGWLVWRLVAKQDSGSFPVDEVEQFDIRNDGSEIWHILQVAAEKLKRKVPAENSQ
jgi:mannan endo-1,4-beta-mannosidase